MTAVTVSPRSSALAFALSAFPVYAAVKFVKAWLAWEREMDLNKRFKGSA